MSTTATAPVKAPLAMEAARGCELTPAAQSLLTKDIKIPQYLAQLARNNLWIDALHFAPFGLPRKEAVWWACLCLWQHYRPTPEPNVDACLKAVVDWIREPTEAHRRTAQQAGHDAGSATPAGNLALAVFLSEGSISLPGRPEVPANPKHMPHLLGQAVLLAVRQTPHDLAVAHQTDYVRLAMELLAGRWPKPAAE